MTKRLLGFLLACLLLFSAAVAESASPDFLGDWYVTQLISDDTAYSLADLNISMKVTFNQDQTAAILISDDENEEESAAAWNLKEDGSFSFMEVGTQVEIPLRREDNTLILGDAQDYYILKREPGEPVSFVEVKQAESAAEFDGDYAVTYVSANGFTLAASAAIDEILETVGAENTGISIRGSQVTMLGGEPAVFSFSPEDGTLKLETGDESQNIQIFLLEDGGIAALMYGITFYAAPVK